ncbi:unnamed protein product [Rotaria sp. Silwood2]|nr:unnamed protein product [Rotaria sp. Silwood2]CAF3055784.1 unnamed protein product [Rotaria sp. Silwood2]CAF3334520.1 unnamed protein product [Rotaria sp. Silwood2]CAF3485813.1 unnamed protein product [Rotaria sp. Silwood2]CAF4380032.1 unnamed protein product [Rotaria sp. Silwood2]
MDTSTPSISSSETCNMLLSNADDMQSITPSEITSTNSMKTCAEITNDESRRKTLLKLVETRWVEKQLAVLVFRQLFSAIIIALEQIAIDGDEESFSLSRGYLKSLLDSEFCIPLIIVSRVFAVIKPCAEQLQTTTLDLIKCYESIEQVAMHLSEMMHDDQQINKLYDELVTFTSEHNISIILPGQYKKTMKELFSDVYQTFVSNTITELSYRFMEHQKIIVRISRLIPLHVVSTKFNELKEVIEFYLDDLPSNDMIVIETEIDLWRSYWSSRSEHDRPTTIEQALKWTHDMRAFYPNIWRLLELFAVLPVTVANAERSFSVLKRIKTYLRNSMGDDRLSSLAILNIHQSIINDDEDSIQIVDNFVRQKRRIKFN